MEKDFYDKLRDKTERIVAKGLELAQRDVMPDHFCQPDCASCLSAEARGLVDEEDFGLGFNSSEDVCMLEARSILAEKLNWSIR